MRKPIPWPEVGSAAFILCFVVYQLRGVLFLGSDTFPHDNLFWNYPIFHFYAHNLMNGSLPLWNPFSHGGEPFYPLLLQMRLLDPIPLGTVLVGQFFTQKIILLFHWMRFLENIFFVTGSYFLLRNLSKTPLGKFLLLSILLLSSFFLMSFRQDGVPHSFLWTPYLLLPLNRIVFVPNAKRIHWVLLAICLGINFQSYFFAGIWTWLFLWCLGLILFNRKAVIDTFKQRGAVVSVLMSIGVLSLMALPNLSVIGDSARWVFPARMIPSEYSSVELGSPFPMEPRLESREMPFKLPYSFIRQTGGRTQATDFLQMLDPTGNRSIFLSSENTWGKPSDLFLYVGIFPYFLGLFGVVFGKERTKKLWAFATGLMILIMLGPVGIIHPLLYPIFPPFWVVRNTGCFALFFLLGFLYFILMGFRALENSDAFFSQKKKWALYLLLIGAHLQWMPKPLPICLSFIAFLILLLGTRRFQTLSLGLMVLITIVDLGYHFRKADSLYGIQKPIEELYHFPLANQPITRPGPREVAPDYPITLFSQAPRYLELIAKRPVALSPSLGLDGWPYQPQANDWEDHLKNYRWNSYLLQKNYHVLVNTDDPNALFSKFRIGKDHLFWVPQNGERAFSEINYESYKYNERHIKIKTTKSGTLKISEGFDPYWTATINEVAAPLSLSEGNFMSVPIEPGVSRVVLRYRPWPFLLGLAGFYFPLLALLGSSLVMTAAKWIGYLRSVPLVQRPAAAQ